MDKVLDKYILLNDVQKKYARTQDVVDKCMLDVAIIAQAQQNELSLRLLDLKRKVRDDDKWLHTIHDTHEIVMYDNYIYVPRSLREKHILNWCHHYLIHASATRLAKTVQQSCDWHVLVVDCARRESKCTICRKISLNAVGYLLKPQTQHRV